MDDGEQENQIPPSGPPASGPPASGPPAGPPPQYAPVPTAPGVAPLPGPPPMPAIDRVQAAWRHRVETDYVFDYWTALGWTVLTLGIYGYYVFYQLVRRMRDHNARRVELDRKSTRL